jgi:hypothetical protein
MEIMIVAYANTARTRIHRPSVVVPRMGTIPNRLRRNGHLRIRDAYFWLCARHVLRYTE